MQQIGMPLRTQAVFDELLSRTWFSTPGDSTIPLKPKRVPDPDNILLTLSLHSSTQDFWKFSPGIRECEGFTVFKHDELPDSLRSFTAQDLPKHSMPEMIDITWADDLVVVLQHSESTDTDFQS